MQTIDKLKFSLTGAKIGLTPKTVDEILKRWQEPWRHYHNLDHLSSIVDEIWRIFLENKLTQEELLIMELTALFHDVYYVPGYPSNELKSIEIFKSYDLEIGPDATRAVTESIMATASSTRPPKEDRLERLFWEIDNSILIQSSFDDMLKYEEHIRKEFQRFSYHLYKEERIKFLKSWLAENSDHVVDDTHIHFLIKYVESYVPKIGIYPGSFNPFHKGHLNILEKAEKMFDKVIIAIGRNPEKEMSEDSLAIMTNPQRIAFRQVEAYDGLLTNFVKKIEEFADVTVIRGLRNGDDLDYEVNQLRHIEILKPDISMTFVVCDKEFEHISSSAIRNIRKITDPDAKDLILKYML